MVPVWQFIGIHTVGAIASIRNFRHSAAAAAPLESGACIQLAALNIVYQNACRNALLRETFARRTWPATPA